MKKTLTLMTALLLTVLMMAQEAPRRYGVKSGIVKMASEMMGQKVETLSYFEDYGALERTETEFNGMKLVTISRDGKNYMVDEVTKKVHDLPVQETVNFMALTDEDIKKYKIEVVGVEEILGKSCILYKMEVSQMGQTAKIQASVWEGYTMKSVSSGMGMSMSATVTSFQETPVDAALFVLPEF